MSLGWAPLPSPGFGAIGTWHQKWHSDYKWAYYRVDKARLLPKAVATQRQRWIEREECINNDRR